MIVFLQMPEIFLFLLLLLDLAVSAAVLTLKGRSIVALVVSIPLGVFLAACLFMKVQQRVKSYLKHRRTGITSQTKPPAN